MLISHIFLRSQARPDHDWTKGGLFCEECNATIFSSLAEQEAAISEYERLCDAASKDKAVAKQATHAHAHTHCTPRTHTEMALPLLLPLPYLPLPPLATTTAPFSLPFLLHR